MTTKLRTERKAYSTSLLEVYQRFRGAYRLDRQGDMVAVRTSETSVNLTDYTAQHPRRQWSS
jgi:hypothetical protein